MKKMMISMMLIASAAAFTACTSDDPTSSYYGYDNEGFSGGGAPGSNGGTTAGSGELAEFTIAIDKETAEPTTAAAAQYPEASDNIANCTFETVVNIDMANPVAKDENGVTVSVADGHITANHGKTEGVCYVVTGTTTDGSLTIEGKTDYELNLNGVDITNPASTAINLDSKLAAYIVLTGSNRLSDGTTEDHKSALYSKGKMLFSGTGSLDVYGNYNNGIHSKSYMVFDKGINLYVKAANHGIKTSNVTDDNDAVTSYGVVVINGGIINVETDGAGAKGINAEGDITINGGRVTAICTGNGEWDTDDLETKAAACIKTDLNLTINGGEVYAKATGSGGKGLKADWEGYFNGGKVRVITSGGLYYSNGSTENHNYTGDTDRIDDAYTSSPKGIKIGTKNEHGVLNITGGDIMVRTGGTNGEGIESKGTLDITGGTVMVAAYDDAINSSGDLTISGGTVVAVGLQNDGIDANGNLYIKGGNIVALGGSGAEAGIDADEQHALYITGGSLFAIGGRIDVKLGSTSQGILQTTGSVTANGTVTISDGSTTLGTFNIPPYSYNNGTIVATAPNVKSGSDYTLALSGGTQTVTATASLSSSEMGGDIPGGMNGGMPGGMGGGMPGRP